MSIKKELNAHIVGEERDNSVLISWIDYSPSGTVSEICEQRLAANNTVNSIIIIVIIFISLISY